MDYPIGDPVADRVRAMGVALSQTTAEFILEAMSAATAAGAVVSFDLNYRKDIHVRGAWDHPSRAGGVDRR